ncbi:spermidine synthase [Agromyces salentinus]|uniref:Fused MFS/spermidine synthase n=1 Tax=Agromyces salentinus TaxID=269421 RepID=A0ABP4YWQ9_9MICO|nr:fused MFS/spermidine synthase [Agromyces salentinus]
MDVRGPLTLDLGGLRAELLPARGANGGVSLVVDGITQSHVNPADPTDLQLEYVRCVAAVIDGCLEPASPARVLHLGAGALTLARYVGATRPASVQHVVDLHRELVEFVLDALPLDPALTVTFEYDDARVAVDRSAAHRVEFDLVIVDVFSGSRTPEHLATTEFFDAIASLLGPAGVLVVNTIASSGLGISRTAGATLRDVFADVAALAAPAVFAEAGPGNVVFAASQAELPLRRIRRRIDRTHRRIDLLDGSALTAYLDGAPVSRD